MKYKEIIIATFIIIVLSCVECLLFLYEAPSFLYLSAVYVFCLLKIGYIVIRCFRRIVRIAHLDIPYHRFLLFIAANVVLVVTSFSIDYFCIYKWNPDTFTGLEDTTNDLQRYFKLFYLSLLMFTNMGVANVIPVAIASEALVMFEAIVSFVTLIFILSDYVTLRESLSRLRKEQQEKSDKEHS
ncbi:MAG: hypothetical protein NZ529_03535 [Cytophagaceae bacterium]|nr:hypothetical protein [Cytophagaceae bacterium]MDW8455842.1 hypothetical protein [Cytophagaceae bacterium]